MIMLPRTPYKQFKVIGAIAISTGLILSGLNFPASAAPITSYSGHLGNSYSDRTKVLTPKWQTSVDYVADGPMSAAADNGMVFYTLQNKLTAANVNTGKVVWSSSSKRISNLIASNNAVFYVDSTGTLLKLNGQTGKVGWTVKSAIAVKADIDVQVFLQSGTLYVVGFNQFAAYDVQSGKKKWQIKPRSTYGFDLSGVHDGVVLTSALVDENPAKQYAAYDAATGKLLWTLAEGHSGILEYRSGTIYTLKEGTSSGKGYAATIDQIDVKTGKILSSYSYIPVKDVVNQSARQVVIDGTTIYIVQELSDSNSRVSEFVLGQDPAKQTPKVTEGRGLWLAGVYKGLHFYEDNDQLVARKVNSDDYTPFLGPNNPINRLDLIGNGAYVGLTDGQFYLTNALTGKVTGKIKTAARSFGTTLVEKNTVIIQAENKLIAVQLPVGLQ